MHPRDDLSHSAAALPFDPEFGPLPAGHGALARDALASAAVLGDTAHPDRVAGFVMTPPHIGWAILAAARKLVPGATFCEWGAGIGLMTFLAERAGFKAWGVELEPSLIAAGRALGARHGARAPLIQGSYKPEGFFSGAPVADPDLLRIKGYDLFRVDVTFVFAWPAEALHVQRFFANHAAPGAILLLYGGGITVSAWRQPKD